MKKKYQARYRRLDSYYGCVETTAEDAEIAKRRIEDYLESCGTLYSKIEEVVEVKDPPFCGSGPCQYDGMLAN